MKAGHENIRHPGEIIDPFWANRNNLAETRTHREILVHFAMRLATETADTAFRIMVYVVLAHRSPWFGNPLETV
jgi:hypothetical protein